tara:strand:- start:1485 stop:3431 length:1947 start_codon:yes stop_codon:yes gene_type:complete
MAKLGDLVVRIGADTRDLNKSLGRVQRNMRSMTSNITKLGQDMTRSVTLPIIGIGAAALKSAADLQTMETSFVSLTGGTKQAADMMKQLNAFTAKTPFQIDAVAKSARQLIASGTEVSQVNEQLQFLGDIAATSGAGIDDIAAIFSKVNAKGKVELESLNQLAERGIPIFAALAEATGLPADKLGAGAVSVEQFNDVLKGFTEEGGFAAGAMLRLSNTVSGKFSTALDNAKLAAASLGEQILPFAGKALDAFTNLAQKFTELDDSTKQIGIAIAGVAASFGPLLVILPKIVQGLTLLTSPISASVLAIGALVAAFVYFYDDVRPIITQVANLMIMLYNKIVPIRIVVAFVQTAFTNLGKAIATAFRAALDIISTLVKSLSQLISGDFSGAFDTITTGLKDVAVDVVTTGAEIGTDLINAVNEAIYAEEIDLLGEDALPTRAEIMERFSSLFSGVGAVVEESLAPATQTVTDLFKKLEAVTVEVSANVTDNVEKMSDSMKTMLDAFSNGVQQAVQDSMSFGAAALLVAKQVVLAYLAAAKAKVVENAATSSAAAGPAFPVLMAGLIGAGMGLINSVQIPALANGGLAYGPTTALVGDNRNARIDPEVIAPLSKLKDMMSSNAVEVFGRISGSDIYLSNTRTTTDRQRYA